VGERRESQTYETTPAEPRRKPAALRAAPDAPFTARRPLAVAMLLFTLTTLFYLPSVRFDFIYDDHELIVEQPPPQNPGDVLQVFVERHWYNLPYYRPLARFTMVVQKGLHGNRPGPFHLFNAATMGAIAVAVWALLRSPALGVGAGPAAIAALLVALHPAASCTVYPICSGRETMLPALFMLGGGLRLASR
jgi:hypothetical protein